MSNSGPTIPTMPTCHICGKNFSLLITLRQHLKRIHLIHNSSIKDLVPRKKKAGVFKYNCSECPKSFNDIKNYNRHVRSHTGAPSQIKVQVLNCPLCDFAGEYNDIIDHFKDVHNISYEAENLEFDTWKTFIEWKKLTEKRTCCKFILKRRKERKTVHYICHKSGFFKSRGKNLRQMKLQGSKKIQGFCPASIDIKIDKVCTVKFVSTHVCKHVHKVCMIIKKNCNDVDISNTHSPESDSIHGSINKVDLCPTDTLIPMTDLCKPIYIDEIQNVLITDREQDVSEEDVVKTLKEIWSLAQTKRHRDLIMEELLKIKLCIAAETTLPANSDKKLSRPRDYFRKILPQKRLYSTKKKPKKKSNTFEHLASEEEDYLNLEVMCDVIVKCED